MNEQFDCTDFPARAEARMAALERQIQAQTATIRALRGQLNACEFRLRNLEAQIEQNTGTLE